MANKVDRGRSPFVYKDFGRILPRNGFDRFPKQDKGDHCCWKFVRYKEVDCTLFIQHSERISLIQVRDNFLNRLSYLEIVFGIKPDFLGNGNFEDQYKKVFEVVKKNPQAAYKTGMIAARADLQDDEGVVRSAEKQRTEFKKAHPDYLLPQLPDEWLKYVKENENPEQDKHHTKNYSRNQYRVRASQCKWGGGRIT